MRMIREEENDNCKNEQISEQTPEYNEKSKLKEKRN